MRNEEELFEDLTLEVSNLTKEFSDPTNSLKQVATLLRSNVDHYNWVGFYLANRDSKMLKLGPYSGDPTEHDQIEFGQGVCGQVAETEDQFVLQDVSTENNYLACSPDVQSEIVMPIHHRGEFVGEVDIDSHKKSPFTNWDEQLLTKIAESLAPLVNETRNQVVADSEQG